MTATKPMKAMFTQSQLESIAAALADTDEGLTGSEITHLLATARINDPAPGITKRHRLYNALVDSQNTRRDRIHILAIEEPENSLSPFFLSKIMTLVREIGELPSAQVFISSHIHRQSCRRRSARTQSAHKKAQAGTRH